MEARLKKSTTLYMQILRAHLLGVDVHRALGREAGALLRPTASTLPRSTGPQQLTKSRDGAWCIRAFCAGHI